MQDQINQNSETNLQESKGKTHLGIVIVGILMIIWGVLGFWSLIAALSLGAELNFYLSTGAIIGFLMALLFVISGFGLLIGRKWAIYSFLVLLGLQFIVGLLVYLNPQKQTSGLGEFVEMIVYAVFLVYIYTQRRFLK
jgi:hypothetical protein